MLRDFKNTSFKFAELKENFYRLSVGFYYITLFSEAKLIEEFVN